MVHHIGQVMWSKTKVHEEHDSSHARDPEVHLVVPVGVPVHHPDPVPYLDSQAVQSAGQLLHPRVGFRIGIPVHPGCRLADDLLLLEVACAVFDDVDEVELKVILHGRREALDRFHLSLLSSFRCLIPLFRM